MPEKTEEFVFEDRKPETSYGINFDWSDVWDAGPLKFVQGIDFLCSIVKFQKYCHIRARQKKMQIKTQKISDTEIVVEIGHVQSPFSQRTS